MNRKKLETLLLEIESRCNAATPGPWVKDFDGTKGHIKSIANMPENSPTVCKYNIWTNMGLSLSEDNQHVKDENPNGEFIAHARQDIPMLIDIVRSLLKELLVKNEN